MPAPLSMDLRKRIINDYKLRPNALRLAKKYSVNPKTVYKLVKQYEEKGHFKPKKRRVWQAPAISKQKIVGLVRAHPDWTQRQYANRLGVKSTSTVSDAIKKAGITRKKKTFQSPDKDPEKIAKFLQEKDVLEKEKRAFYFMDQSGMSVHENSPDYAYSKKGTRCFDKRSMKSRVRVNTMAISDLNKKFKDSTTYYCMTNRKRVEDFFEQAFPKLPSGSVLVLDNASFHKGGRLKEIADKYNIKLLYLPPYCPEYNSIEKLWNMLKTKAKRLCAELGLAVYDAINYAYKLFGLPMAN